MGASGTLLRLAAFTTDPRGGNPAGVWIGETLPTRPEMQRIAAEVGYSETAFLAPDESGLPGHFRVRYFSPLAEVPFCGHATIASGVALSERGQAVSTGRPGGPRELVVETNGGPVALGVETGADGFGAGDPDVGRRLGPRGRCRAPRRLARPAGLADRRARPDAPAGARIRRRDAPDHRGARPATARGPRLPVRGAARR